MSARSRTKQENVISLCSCATRFPLPSSSMLIVTDERCMGYSHPGHPERPARVAGTLDKLRTQTELELTWAGPMPVLDAT